MNIPTSPCPICFTAPPARAGNLHCLAKLRSHGCSPCITSLTCIPPRFSD